MSKEARFADFALLLRDTDDVAVIKRPVRAGTELFNDSIRLIAGRDIPAGHKLALKAIPDGAPVRKYGQVIGFAKGDIAPGDHVHTHNLASTRGRGVVATAIGSSGGRRNVHAPASGRRSRPEFVSRDARLLNASHCVREPRSRLRHRIDS